MRTGLRHFSASSAAWRAMIEGYSSLPPKPPPVSAWTTTASSSPMFSARFIALWM